ncbi:MAG: PAS domain-containing protein, partial [Schwartzia sp.]|nr:PAS domain-containing protein [Schwartzia sp. (in: firmicutes)]
FNFKEARENAMRDIWQTPGGRADYDVVCTVGDESLRFVLDERETLFSGLPVVFTGVRSLETARRAAYDNMMVGGAVGLSIRRTIELARLVDPKLNHIVGITDGTATGVGLGTEFMRLKETFPEYSISLLDASEMTETEIADACRAFDRNTLPVFLALDEDKTGKQYSFHQAVRLIADNATVPVYSVDASTIGEGFIGGVAVPYRALGEAAGAAIRQILNGGSVADISINVEAVPIFDETLMAVAGVARDMLPFNTQYVCELPPFWTRYRGAVLPVGIFVTAILVVLGGLWVDSRRHAELLRETQAEEKRLASLVENIPAGVGIYVFEDNVLKSAYLNDGYYKMLGVDKAKRIAERKEFFQFVHPDDLPAVLEEIQKDIMEDRDFEGIFRLLDGNGKYRWTNLRVRLVEKQGNRKTYYGAFHDNDSVIQAHQELHESQEMMKAAIEHSDLQAWVYDPETGKGDAIVIDPSRQIEDYGKMDYPNDAVKSGLVHPDDVEKFLSLHRRMKAGEAEAEAVIRIRKAGVGYHWERVRYTRLRDVAGREARVLGTAQDMDAYKELEQKFQTTITQTGIAVGVYDIKSHHFEVTYRDQHYEFQNAPDDVVAQGFIHHEDEEKYRSYFLRMEAGESTAGGLVRFMSGGGAAYRWFHFIMTAIPDRDGRPFRAMSTRLDVTEQVRREMRYREELMRRQSLENEVVFALTVNVTQNTVQELIESGVHLAFATGKTFDWVVEREMSRLPEEKDRKAFREFADLRRLTRAIHEGEIDKSIEYLRRFENGELRWACMRADLMENPETGEWMIFANVRDIHEAKVDEIAFSNVVEGMIDYVTCLDVSTGQARFIRKPTKEALPLEGLDAYFDFEESTRQAAQLLPDLTERQNLLRRYTVRNLVEELEENNLVSFSCWLDANGEHRRKELRAFYLGSAKSLIVNIQRDITEMYIEAEKKREELRKALADAEAASRAKSDFLSRMSHEIRTPMNAIIGLTALAKGRAEDTKYVRESLSKMDSAAHFLLGLINDVLDLSRIERGKMQLDNTPHDMTEFLEGIDVIIRARAAEGFVRYTRTEKGRLPAACVFDALKLKQVLVNILSNAVKFTPRDGAVDFIVETLGITGEWATLRFTIRDTGIGIDQAFLPHIFDAFEQESAGNTTRFGGTGLGLAISKNIIDLMGGSIRVESEKGVGSIFFVSVTLPVTSLTGGSKADDEGAADFTGMRVLLAEDNEINREIATAILEDKGFTVDSVTDGEEAVAKFSESGAGAYDVILMDIRMPFLDGFGATERIRAMDGRPDAATIPIVAMTANAFEEDVQRARAVGMDEYLTKPVEPDTVYKVLWKILRKKKG